MAQHIIACLVRDAPGVLHRISGLFARRGFNINSITEGPTTKEGVSRMTIVVNGDERALEQVTKQLNKQIDIIKVSDLPPLDSVIKELCLIKINAPTQDEKTKIMKFAETFKTKIVDANPQNLTVEITGSPSKISAFIEIIKPFGIKELPYYSFTGVLPFSFGSLATGISSFGFGL